MPSVRAAVRHVGAPEPARRGVGAGTNAPRSEDLQFGCLPPSIPGRVVCAVPAVRAHPGASGFDDVSGRGAGQSPGALMVVGAGNVASLLKLDPEE